MPYCNPVKTLLAIVSTEVLFKPYGDGCGERRFDLP
jgi:hypothetical protein